MVNLARKYENHRGQNERAKSKNKKWQPPGAYPVRVTRLEPRGLIGHAVEIGVDAQALAGDHEANSDLDF